MEQVTLSYYYVDFTRTDSIDRQQRAVGVEYKFNSGLLPGANDAVHVVRAKLVILSAGWLGSPAILERSGIGAKDALEKAGVRQVVDLPGVGENFIGQLPIPRTP